MTPTQTLAVIAAAVLALAWVAWRVRAAARVTRREAIDAAMGRHPAGSACEASPFSRRPIPGVTTEHVTPLDPADLPTVTTDAEALEAMRRLALEAAIAEAEEAWDRDVWGGR